MYTYATVHNKYHHIFKECSAMKMKAKNFTISYLKNLFV